MQRHFSTLASVCNNQIVVGCDSVSIDGELDLLEYYRKISAYQHLVDKKLIEAIFWPEIYPLAWQDILKLTLFAKHRFKDNPKYQ